MEILLNLPHTEDVEQAFGDVTHQHDKIVSKRASFAYDVCNELVIDATIAPRLSCEKDLALQHLSAINHHNDLLVSDRGYTSPCELLAHTFHRLLKINFNIHALINKLYV